MSTLRAVVWILPLLLTSLSATEIVGTVTGHDDKPLLRAMVILRDGVGNNLSSAYAAPDGSFSLKTDQAGLFRVQFIGAFHENQQVYVLASASDSTPVRIAARLEAHKYHPDPKVRLFAYGQPALDQKPFTLQPDGTWILEFAYAKDELLTGLSGVAVSGGVAIPSSSEHRRQFNRILTVLRPENGRIRVVFDPRKLPHSDRPSALSFGPGQDPRLVTSEICTSIRKAVDAQAERRQKARTGGAIRPSRGAAAIEAAFRQASAEKTRHYARCGGCYTWFTPWKASPSSRRESASRWANSGRHHRFGLWPLEQPRRPPARQVTSTTFSRLLPVNRSR